MNTEIMKTERICELSLCNVNTYDDEREFTHYGYVDSEGKFHYDGNFEAIDNGLYSFYPDEDTPEVYVLAYGEYHGLRYDN